MAPEPPRIHVAPTIPDEGLLEGRLSRLRYVLRASDHPLAHSWPEWQARYWQLAPDADAAAPESNYLLVVCYRAMRVHAEAEVGRRFDLGGVRGALIYDRPVFIVAPPFRVEDDLSISPREGTWSQAPLGSYCLLTYPADLTNPSGDVQPRHRINRAAALLALIEGYNAVFERVFENVVPREGLPSAWSPSLPVAEAHPRPNWSAQRVGHWETVAAALADLPGPQRERADLSFAWLHRATTTGGTDAFLAYWIAIETLVMPDGTDIRPVEEQLARIYSLDLTPARRRFQIGRIFGLRSRIVHDGLTFPIRDALLTYLHSVAYDLILDTLGLPSERRTEALLNRAGFRLRAYLL